MIYDKLYFLTFEVTFAHILLILLILLYISAGLYVVNTLLDEDDYKYKIFAILRWPKYLRIKEERELYA